MIQAYFGMLPPTMFGSAGGSPPPYNSVIDFTAATLDPRVTYSGPAHAYVTQSGDVAQSTANSWPLEFSSGAAVGRSLPEPTGNNLVSAVQPEFMTAGATEGWRQFYAEASGNSFHRVRFNSSASGVVSFQVLFKPVGRGFACFRAAVNAANVYRNIGIKADGTITFTGAGFNNTRVEDIGGGMLLLQTQFNMASGVVGFLTAASEVTDDVVPTTTADTSCGLWIGYPQIEAFNKTTSPIAVAGTRSAASATITDEMALSAVVSYSDGTTATLTGADGVFTIPNATDNWRARFIKQVELRG